ncbi:MAG: hypothetical protein ACXVA7_22620, partial [Isosphaeraceae bacterium]
RRGPRTVRKAATLNASSAGTPSPLAARESADLVSRPILLPDPSWGWWPISDGGLLVRPETD